MTAILICGYKDRYLESIRNYADLVKWWYMFSCKIHDLLPQELCFQYQIWFPSCLIRQLLVTSKIWVTLLHPYGYLAILIIVDSKCHSWVGPLVASFLPILLKFILRVEAFRSDPAQISPMSKVHERTYLQSLGGSHQWQ